MQRDEDGTGGSSKSGWQGAVEEEGRTIQEEEQHV